MPYWKCHRCRLLAPSVRVRPVCRRCGLPCSRVVPPYESPAPEAASYDPPVSPGCWDLITGTSEEMRAFNT